ncbi:hypothetical protein [Silvibacterium acidisoli]|uniref:hypothetical protein n=1 Tax=Acidobacteriaceae bacterium ZG23-2 TaxID=2883246 RepID=UPI00406C6123
MKISLRSLSSGRMRFSKMLLMASALVALSIPVCLAQAPPPTPRETLAQRCIRHAGIARDIAKDRDAGYLREQETSRARERFENAGGDKWTPEERTSEFAVQSVMVDRIYGMYINVPPDRIYARYAGVCRQLGQPAK